jgi:hypothetical protein
MLVWKPQMLPEGLDMNGEEEAACPKPLLFPTIQYSSKRKRKKLSMSRDPPTQLILQILQKPKAFLPPR